MSRPTVDRDSLLSGLSLYPVASRRLGFLHPVRFEHSNLHGHQQHQQLLAELDGLFHEWLGALCRALRASYYYHWAYSDSITSVSDLPVAVRELK